MLIIYLTFLSDSMWIVFALISSFILGVYDIFKKISLQNNRVISVLYISCLISACIFLILIGLSKWVPSVSNYQNLYIPEQKFSAHLLYFGKATLVGSSWIFAYYAIKHLPVTMVSAIRSSSPVWTLLGAILIFNEQLNLFQWIGIIITIVFYYIFGITGRKEGIQYWGNRWIFFAIAATILGSISALFDKYLVANYNRMALQAWFAIYMPIFLFPFLLIENKYLNLNSTTFVWRWTIPMIGISLVLADFFYFLALAQPGSMISMVSSLRRTSVIFTFFMAGMILKETNIVRKILILAGILIGIGFIIYGSAK